MDSITQTLAQILTKFSNQLAMGAMLVLVIMLAASIGQTVVFIMQESAARVVPAVPSFETRDEATASTEPTTDIAAMNLFGVVAETPTEPVVVDAPETRLNLVLQGVFTADDPDESSAIVAEGNRAGELYQIGERLPGNATLSAVYDDHILIKRGGRVEKLMFTDAAFRAPVASNTRNPAVSAAASLTGDPAQSSRLQNIRERILARRNQERPVSEQLSTPSPATAGGSPASLVERYRERMRSDPSGLMNQLGVEPVGNGTAEGYRITGGELPEAVLRQSGLQRGDVVLSVNGQSVGNIASDQAIVDQAMASGRVRVEVQRGERKFYLTVPIPR